LPELRREDARVALQDGVQDLRVLFELQRLLLRGFEVRGSQLDWAIL
jgi:hypothetical protein